MNHAIKVILKMMLATKASYIILDESQRVEGSIQITPCKKVHQAKQVDLLNVHPFCSQEGWTFEMCVDYRAFNEVTMENKYNFSQIDDFFNEFSVAKMFRKIDICLVYYQIRITKGDEENIVCHTRYVS
jgi:hypothetical protein